MDFKSKSGMTEFAAVFLLLWLTRAASYWWSPLFAAFSKVNLKRLQTNNKRNLFKFLFCPEWIFFVRILGCLFFGISHWKNNNIKTEICCIFKNCISSESFKLCKVKKGGFNLRVKICAVQIVENYEPCMREVNCTQTPDSTVAHATFMCFTST